MAELNKTLAGDLAGDSMKSNRDDSMGVWELRPTRSNIAFFGGEENSDLLRFRWCRLWWHKLCWKAAKVRSFD